MVILEIFTKNIQATYKSTLLSKATLLILIFGIITVVLPFIFAYKSQGFWMKRDIFYEQPDIRFKGEYIFTAFTSNKSQIITCSSLPFYENKMDFLDRCSSIKVREIDKNFDGKMDKLHLQLHIYLPSKNIEITHFYLIVPLDYKIHNVCPLQMQTALIIEKNLPFKVANFSIIGDVELIQSSPIKCYKNRNIYYNYSIIANEKNLEDYTVFRISKEYSWRNISTKLGNVYTSFALGETQDFSLDLQLRYPEHRIIYKPGFWQIIKWAWIQYFAIYIIISWLVARIKNYIFTRRLVLFYEDNPVKKKE